MAGDGAVASDGDSVAVHYHGTLDDGTVFDSSLEREPLEFVVGSGQMITGFDNAVRGLSVGESVKVRLEPAEAYGERQLMRDVPNTDLPPNLSIGDLLQGSGGVTARVVTIDETSTTVAVDNNHPFAGQALTFEIELVRINQP